MQHILIERWSRGQSWLHARDARVKIVVLLAYLIALALVRPFTATAFASFAVVGATGIAVARLPMFAVFSRAATVLPFSLIFALISYVAGDTQRAAALLGKSYLSAVAVLAVVGSTPMPDLMRGAEGLGTPRILALVIQFLYRYLFVITGQAISMWSAALCRGLAHSTSTKTERFRAAAGALAVLFARSYAKADGIQRAMLARGFEGSFPRFHQRSFGVSDALLGTAGLGLVAGAFWLARGLA